MREMGIVELPRGPRLPLYAVVAADSISRFGNLLTATAVPWFVLVTTGSAARTGITVFVSAVPVVLALFFGGAIIDRSSFRRISILADLSSGVFVAAIPLLHHTVGLAFWQLLVLVFCGALLDVPASVARYSALPDLARLGGIRIERATAIAESLAQVLALVGPALAGVLIAVVGPSNVLWIDAATFAISAAVLATCVPEPARRAATATAGYLADLAAGLRFVRHEPVLFPLVVAFFAMNVAIGPIDTLILPVYAREVFDSSIAFGLMAAAGGVGALAGTTVFGWIGHRFSRRAVFGGGFLAVPLALGTLAFKPNLPITLAILALLGLALGLTNLLEYTIYFERIPEGMRARALGITGAIGWGSTPLGRIGTGYLLEWLSLSGGLGVLAVVFLPLPLALFAVRALRDLDSPTAATTGSSTAPDDRIP